MPKTHLLALVSKRVSLLPTASWPLPRPSKFAAQNQTFHLWGIPRPVAYRFPLLFQASTYHRCGQRLHSSIPAYAKCSQQETKELQPTPLNAGQLKEIYAGSYPTNFDEDSIHLKNISTSEANKLWKAFENNEEENRRQRVSLKHDAAFSTASIFRSPSPVHEALIEGIRDPLIENGLDEDLFSLSTNKKIDSPLSPLTDTPMIPDVILSYEDLGKAPPAPIFVTEVGFTETYEDLRRSVAFWLGETSTVKLVLLGKIFEQPVYRTPKPLSQAVLAIKNLPPNKIQSHVYGAISDRNGQTFIHDARFVGRISGFLEVWVRDSQTGKGVLKGERIDFYNSTKLDKPKPENLTLSMSDFCPPDQVGDSVFTLDWKSVHKKMWKARRELAILRCSQALKIASD